MMTTLILAAALAVPGEAELKARIPDIFAKSAAHYRALDAAATPLMKDEKGGLRTPHGWKKWKTGKDELDMRSIFDWTAGHYAGSLWLLYEATGDAFFRDRAVVWTEILEPNKTADTNHDLGFIMYCSYGNARRLLKTDRYDAILAETANTLSLRFNEPLGLIRSWGKKDDGKDFLVIPDNMMNLELLMWASQHGDERAGRIARSHADVTMRHHFRADGGTYHVLNYDQRPGFLGTVQEIRRGQGLGCETAWSRGQSWAIYGYTMMYRETKNPAYLAFARKLADFAIGHPNMPADGVPYWDYGASGEERDTSAASVMASGLLELAGFVGGEKGAAYRAFAVKQLLSLASPAYFSEGGEIGHFLLKHGVGHKPGNSEVDTPLDYGDYYFLEALLRFRSSASQTREADPARVREIASFLRDEPGDPAMRIGNRAVWDRFAALKDAPDRIRAAESLLQEPVPVMTDEMFLRYYEKDRSLDPSAVPYYVPFWKRRDGLSALVIAECLENRGRFLPKAEEYIRAICAMRTWVQPSHDKDHRGFDGLVKIIDLGSAEMSVTLALAGDWLRDVLDPETRRLISAALEEQIYSRYRLFNRGEMRPNWFFGDMNWTAVCNGCSTVAALAMLPDRNVRAEFVEAAERTLPGYVNGGFYPDGACKEGMDYWNYGFGNFLRAALYIRRLTGGKVDLTSGGQCERDFAFAFEGMLAPWKAPHFADGAANPNPQVLQLGQVVWPQYRTDVADSCGILGVGIARMAAFAFEPGLADRKGGAGPLKLPIRSYLPDAQMLYCRPEGSPADGLYAVMKGGTNGEGHNHNDLGTYTVMFGGVEMAGDPGGAQYTKKTFSSHRYENPILSSFGHPVPVVAGKLQSEGAQFAAKTAGKRFTDEKDVFKLDLSGAYEAPELASLVRTMGYARQKGVVGFLDEVKFKAPSAFEVPTVTFCKVTTTETKGVYVLEDEKTSARLTCRFSATGGEWTMKSERIPNPKRREPTRLALAFTAPVAEATVSVVFSKL